MIQSRAHRERTFKITLIYCFLKLSISSLAGSTYCGPVPFDVCKRKPNEETVSADSAKDVISITIPREWRGSSEILVFLSLQPVQGWLKEIFVNIML